MLLIVTFDAVLSQSKKPDGMRLRIRNVDMA
jgi:hypothetical protein